MKNRKTIIAIVSVIAVVLVLIGVTYAYWLVTKTQVGENVISSACLDISMTGSNDINLPDQFPMSSNDGLKTTPYTFTVTNNCDTEVDYQINLETLGEESNTISPHAIRVVLGINPAPLLSENIEVTPTIEDAYTAKIIGFGTLAAASETSTADTETYELRIWIDENAPISEQNKTFRSKITVSVGQNVKIDIWDGTSATALADLDINETTKTVKINSAADLAGFRDAVNAGSLQEYNVKLNTSIDLNHMSWTPIGTKTTDSYATNFTGTFDGNGYIIKGIEVSTTTPAGLFGYVGGEKDVTIKNLTIEGNVTSTSKVAGGLIAYIDYNEAATPTVTIDNIKSYVNVTSADAIGSIAGRSYNYGDTIITNCVNYADLAATNPDNNRGKIGGILGLHADGKLTVTNCVNNGNISNGWHIGGILGYFDTEATIEFENLTNNGDITSITNVSSTNYLGTNAGGIIGMNADYYMSNEAGYIKNCTNNGDVTSFDYAGGIGGAIFNLEIINSNNYGNINATGNVVNAGSTPYTGPVGRAGGILGWGREIISIDSSNNYGNVHGTNAAGGVVGYVEMEQRFANTNSAGKKVIMTNCNGGSTAITTTNGAIGRIIGKEYISSAVRSDSSRYILTELTGSTSDNLKLIGSVGSTY